MYNSMIEAIKEESIQLLFHVDIDRVAMTQDLQSEQDEDAAVDAAEAQMGIEDAAPADQTVASGPSEPETDDEAEAEAIDELAAQSESGSESADEDDVTRDENGNPMWNAKGKKILKSCYRGLQDGVWDILGGAG